MTVRNGSGLPTLHAVEELPDGRFAISLISRGSCVTRKVSRLTAEMLATNPTAAESWLRRHA